MDDYSAEMNPRLFPHFAPHSLLHALGRFEEAGKGAVPVWRPALLAPKEDLLAIGGDYGHDDCRVGAWEA